jgi:hypothetical protein
MFQSCTSLRQMQRLSPVTFTYNDRTIQQLKNGGNMQLIRKSKVTDAAVLYDAAVRDIYYTGKGKRLYVYAAKPSAYLQNL